MRSKVKKYWKIVVLLIIVAIAALFFYHTDLLSFIPYWNPEQLLQLANNNFALLLLITLFLMIIQNLFSVIPLLLLISINVSLFDFIYGYLWSWLTSVLGAIVTFHIARSGFQRFFRLRNQRIINRIERNGFYFVLIGKLFPLIPSSVINIAAGVSSVSFKRFTYGTLIGNLIYLFVLSLIHIGFKSVFYS